MDIPLNAEVKCVDGTIGRSVCIIIDPVYKAVTHVVTKTKGLLGVKYMVPVDRISSSTPQQIQLLSTLEELAEMEPFVHSQFIGPKDSEYRFYQSTTFEFGADDSFLWPYIAPEDSGMYIDVEQFPYDELGIHRGAHVEATDGRIGLVDEFIVNPENDYITHIVLRKGHLWGQKEVTIPVSEIDRMEDDVVYLTLDKNSIKKMPSIPVKRWD